MKRKAIPVQTILTNKRDNESDLGGVHLVESVDQDARPQPSSAIKAQTQVR